MMAMNFSLLLYHTPPYLTFTHPTNFFAAVKRLGSIRGSRRYHLYSNQLNLSPFRMGLPRVLLCLLGSWAIYCGCIIYSTVHGGRSMEFGRWEAAVAVVVVVVVVALGPLKWCSSSDECGNDYSVLNYRVVHIASRLHRYSYEDPSPFAEDDDDDDNYNNHNNHDNDDDVHLGTIWFLLNPDSRGKVSL